MYIQLVHCSKQIENLPGVFLKENHNMSLLKIFHSISEKD